VLYMRILTLWDKREGGIGPGEDLNSNILMNCRDSEDSRMVLMETHSLDQGSKVCGGTLG
jgi:hypothetical protein